MISAVRRGATAGAAGEAPGPPGDDHGRCPGVLADGQLGVRIVEAGDRMRNVIPIREREHVDRAVRPELAQIRAKGSAPTLDGAADARVW